jgi:hypothetical protein
MRVGGRGRGAHPAGPLRAKRLNGSAGSLAESCRKNHFRIKIGVLNIPGLWKFVQGDLGGILIWGFFLNSSRLLKDFRKI